MTIWKFPLHLTDSQEVEMPKSAEVLTVQTQKGSICLWATVESESPRSKRSFRIIGTGHEFDGGLLAYVGTVQQGSFVWHVFERLEDFAGAPDQGAQASEE